jgi:hypothetical protein
METISLEPIGWRAVPLIDHYFDSRSLESVGKTEAAGTGTNNDDSYRHHTLYIDMDELAATQFRRPLKALGKKETFHGVNEHD